jgi:hypothetical protein
MHTPRSHERISTEIAITVTTVLDSLDGVIVDLSEGGCQIVGCSLPPRSQCQVDMDGHIVFGTVRWAEEDRMGVRFPYELSEGPLYDALELARGEKRMPVAFQARETGRFVVGAPVAGGFGRRHA